jgi:hypothetical protein
MNPPGSHVAADGRGVPAGRRSGRTGTGVGAEKRQMPGGAESANEE